eukprot:3446450-Prymnesium_polylepis.1
MSGWDNLEGKIRVQGRAWSKAYAKLRHPGSPRAGPRLTSRSVIRVSPAAVCRAHKPTRAPGRMMARADRAQHNA